MSPKPKEPSEEGCEKDEDLPLSEGQSERSYYYDDSHGYEDFDPENEEDDDDETGDDESSTSSDVRWP